MVDPYSIVNGGAMGSKYCRAVKKFPEKFVALGDVILILQKKAILFVFYEQPDNLSRYKTAPQSFL